MNSMAKDSKERDRDALLVALQAHGQDFLSSFGSIAHTSHQPRRKRRKLDSEAEETVPLALANDIEDSSDEWCGFASSLDALLDEDESPDYSDDMDSDHDEAIEDDGFRSDHQPIKRPEVVVFSEASNSDHPRMSKLQAKSFMSSKASKVREEVVDAGDLKRAYDDDEHYEEDRTNHQNDALLHKLVHTQLLSGSLNSDLNLTPAQRRKALEGRVLELAAGAKLGKGESVIRQEERSKASKRVRMGLERKVEERKSKVLEEAKNLGNYHHSIKHLFDASSDGQPDRRKRERGLKLGVGKFSSGVLKLNREDVASVQSSGDRGRGGGKSFRKRK